MKKILQKIKKIDTKYIHIILIILGSLFVLLSAFHTNMWFDESYSVGLANHSFGEIWKIDVNDVHPVLYYWCLHILNLIFGNNVIVYRLFSVACTIILGIIGYTHVRKDFGENVGILFSFLAFFLPSNLVYSGEIRMYSMTTLTVILTFLYAYRIYKNRIEEKNEKVNIKNWILFGCFSLMSAYTHYYALMAAGLINLGLMVYLIIDSIKNKKFSNELKAFIICAIAQVVAYMPWLITIFNKLSGFSGGFWIGVHFPETYIDVITFCFTGNITYSNLIYINTTISIIWSLAIIVYMIYLYAKDIRKSKSEKKIIKIAMKPAVLAISLFIAVMVAAVIISVLLKQSIVYARYMLCILGALMFFLSYTMVVKGNRKINAIICTVCVIMSLYININLIEANYDISNEEPTNYIEKDIQPDDIFIMDDELSGTAISVKFADNTAYFYNKGNWGVEEAYKAFAKDYRTVVDLKFLDDYKGRIWIINSNTYRILDEIQEMYDVNIIKQEMFNIKYRNQEYSISLIEK